MTNHLAPYTKEYLDVSIAERCAYLMTPKWLGYPVALEAIAKLENLIQLPRSHRMPNLMIFGPSNNGKTMIIRRFMRSHPHNDNPNGDEVEIPVLNVQMPFSPEPRRFYKAILEQLFATYRPSDNLSNLETQAIRLMKACGLKVLVIDELHNILAGRVDTQRQFLNMLRYLGNELEVPIVCLGLHSALRAIQIDEQLANRFEPFALPIWKDGKDYRRLLNSFEAVLPLKKRSFLASDKLSTLILTKSEGTIGEIYMLLRSATQFAITNSIEAIDAEIINRCEYISPRDRRRVAEHG